LTFPDAQDRTLLMRVDRPRAIGGVLRLGPDLTRAAALAAAGERILFAQPRGRAIELFPAACSPPSGGAAADAGSGHSRPSRSQIDAAAPASREPRP
jgi:hypothetical protein